MSVVYGRLKSVESFYNFRFPSLGVKNAQPVTINNMVTLPSKSKYSLNSVICHTGHLLGNGHYVTLAKCPDEKVYLFDDQNVSPVVLVAVVMLKHFLFLSYLELLTGTSFYF